MKISTSEKEIAAAIKTLELANYFDVSDLQFEIRSYEKNEQIASPVKPLRGFIFIISGSVRIYHIDEESIIHSIVTHGAKDLMGYNEFVFDSDNYTPYAETSTKSKVLVLPFRQPHRNLKHDSNFLMFLLRCHLNEQIQHTEMTSFQNALEDKLLFYIENICENKTIKNVNAAVIAMGCSRRQLQRILKKLCDDGVLVHKKRGNYSLI